METWSLEAFKEYVEQRFEAVQRAIDKAETTVDRRLETMNALRNQLQQERNNYMTVTAYDQRHSALEERLSAVADQLTLRILAIERWQSKIVGALAIVALLVPVLTGLTIYLLTHTKGPP